MITLRTLERMPEFGPVREEVTRYAAANGGAAALLATLNRGEIPAIDSLVRWLLGAETPEAHAHRLEAVRIILRHSGGTTTNAVSSSDSDGEGNRR